MFAATGKCCWPEPELDTQLTHKHTMEGSKSKGAGGSGGGAIFGSARLELKLIH